MSDPLLHQEIDLSNFGKYVEANWDDSNVRDHIVTLGTELLCHIFRNFPIEELVACSNVSRRWREMIRIGHFNHHLQTLLQEAYLYRILHHLHRLSSLAFDRVIKISLNLDLFWEEYELHNKMAIENKEMAIEDSSLPFQAWTNTAFSRVLLSLRNCEQTFKEINLQFDRDDWNAVNMLSALVEEIFSFTRLEKVRIKAPSLLCLTAGEDKPGSKYFSLTDDLENSREDRNTDAEFMQLIEQVRDFVGSDPSPKFTRFLLGLDDSDGFRWEDSEELEILGILQDSADVLQSLGISQTWKESPSKTWELATSECPNLNSLSFALPRPRLGDEDFAEAWNLEWNELADLSFPLRSEGASTLKRFVLIAEHYKTDLGSMSRWMGNQIEEISLESIRSEIKPGLPSTSFISILQNLNQTLKSISLNKIQVVEDEVVFDEANLSFPNLESLSLKQVDDCFYGFFADVKCPKLQHLQIDIYSYGSENIKEYPLTAQVSIRCLWNRILQGSSLKSIEFDGSLPSDLELPTSASQCLPELESIKISPLKHERKWLLWFSNFKLPNLTSIKYGDDKITLQKLSQNAPKLNHDIKKKMW